MNSDYTTYTTQTTASPFSLEGKIILVVGADTRTGQQAATTLARMGAHVIQQSTFTLTEIPIDGVLYCSTSAHTPIDMTEIKESCLEQSITNCLAAPALTIKKLLANGLLKEAASVVLERVSIAHTEAGRFISVEGGLKSLAASMALKCASHRIRVNTITTKASPEEADMENFANAAVYLLSPASRWVTGSDLVITGQATN